MAHSIFPPHFQFVFLCDAIYILSTLPFWWIRPFIRYPLVSHYQASSLSFTA